MRAPAIARMEVTRLFRQPINLFFMFVFPMALILVMGAAFGSGFTPTVGVVADGEGGLARNLLTALQDADSYQVTAVADEAALVDGVERGRLQAGVLIPSDYDEVVLTGGSTAVRFVARADQMQLRSAVEAAVARQAAILRAARFSEAETGTSFEEGMGRAQVAAEQTQLIAVRVTTVGEASFPESTGRFDVGASSQLILFVFLMSMMGGIGLIESRRLGVTRRILSTPTSPRQVILGDGLGRFAIALSQGLIIMIGSLLLFRVDWGDPLGAAILLLAMALVGAGAGMLIGSVLRTEQQAVAVSLSLGLGMGALGGSMVPSELFSDTMRTIAHITPHAWAMDGFTQLVQRDGTTGDVAGQTLILLAYAAVLLTVAAWRLRRVMTR